MNRIESDAHTLTGGNLSVKKSTYCYWLLASTMAGNTITNDERKLLSKFLNKEPTATR